MGYRVAVVGATGNVGREMLNILHERQFPVTEVIALASKRSVGREVAFGDKRLKVKALDDFDFTGVDFALFSAGGTIAAKNRPGTAARVGTGIDNSSQFPTGPDGPLIVPDVTSACAGRSSRQTIIANRNCSPAQLVVALKPLHDVAKIRRVVLSTYQSTSGVGNEAMDELFTQTKGIYVSDTPTPQKFTKQIAFNVIPHIDVF